MKLRALFTTLLALIVALPVIAVDWPDVPADHTYGESIRWASEGSNFVGGDPLFLGFPDGRFGPDEELTEGQFNKVVKRLYDSADQWTRGQTAALLHRGYPALRSHLTAGPPPSAVTSYAPGTETCARPLGSPYWETKPDTFRFPVMDTCDQQFIIQVVWNNGQSSTRYDPSETGGEWPDLVWPNNQSLIHVNVEQNGQKLVRSERITQRAVRDGTEATTTTIKQPPQADTCGWPLTDPHWITRLRTFPVPGGPGRVRMRRVQHGSETSSVGQPRASIRSPG